MNGAIGQRCRVECDLAGRDPDGVLEVLGGYREVRRLSIRALGAVETYRDVKVDHAAGLELHSDGSGPVLGPGMP